MQPTPPPASPERDAGPESSIPNEFKMTAPDVIDHERALLQVAYRKIAGLLEYVEHDDGTCSPNHCTCGLDALIATPLNVIPANDEPSRT